MKRRHRRVLFNLFAFLLLGISIYLNMYRMNDGGIALNRTAKLIVKTTEKTGSLSKITEKKIQKN